MGWWGGGNTGGAIAVFNYANFIALFPQFAANPHRRRCSSTSTLLETSGCAMTAQVRSNRRACKTI